mmetsp:Transcript_1183/g.2500  ORF Transcript_1183/g.2500 Transcript_1183/m.2500 type:complete len:272 (+) Transcript_1183:412-1227(+)
MMELYCRVGEDTLIILAMTMMTGRRGNMLSNSNNRTMMIHRRCNLNHSIHRSNKDSNIHNSLSSKGHHGIVINSNSSNKTGTAWMMQRIGMSLLFRVIHHCHPHNIHNSTVGLHLGRDSNSNNNIHIHNSRRRRVEVSNTINTLNNINSNHSNNNNNRSNILNTPHLPICQGMEIPTIAGDLIIICKDKEECHHQATLVKKKKTIGSLTMTMTHWMAKEESNCPQNHREETAWTFPDSTRMSSSPASNDCTVKKSVRWNYPPSTDTFILRR